MNAQGSQHPRGLNRGVVRTCSFLILALASSGARSDPSASDPVIVGADAYVVDDGEWLALDEEPPAALHSGGAQSLALSTATLAATAAPVVTPIRIDFSPPCAFSVEGVACSLLSDGSGNYSLITDAAQGYVVRMEAAHVGELTVDTVLPHIQFPGGVLFDHRVIRAEASGSNSCFYVNNNFLGCGPYLVYRFAINSQCASFAVGGAVVGTWQYLSTFTPDEPPAVTSAASAQQAAANQVAQSATCDVRSESRALFFFPLSPSTIRTALPAEPTLPVEGTLPASVGFPNGFPGFQRPEIAGGTSQVTTILFEQYCGGQTFYGGRDLRFSFTMIGGGHNHTQTGQSAFPAGGTSQGALQTIQGISPTTGSLSGNAFSSATNLQGRVVFNAVAGQVSSRVNILAEEPGNDPASAGNITTSLNVSIAELDDLLDLTSLQSPTLYQLTGQTPAHQSNAWVSFFMIARLEGLAAHFKQQMSGALILRYNDMSLLDGGLFDVTGNFNVVSGGHVYHRTGWDADISQYPYDLTQGQVVTAGWSREKIKDVLRPYLALSNGFLAPEDPIHVRFVP